MNTNGKTSPQGQIAADTYHTPQGIFKGTPTIGHPMVAGFAPKEAVPVGGEVLADTSIEYNGTRRTATLKVRNTGDRPIQVGSHFHFFEVNRYLEFDRTAAFGCHLNIPSTTAIRFEPGDEKEVEVVQFGGKQRIVGFNGLTMGFAGCENTPGYYPARAKAIRKMLKRGFKCSPAPSEACLCETECDDTCECGCKEEKK